MGIINEQAATPADLAKIQKSAGNQDQHVEDGTDDSAARRMFAEMNAGNPKAKKAPKPAKPKAEPVPEVETTEETDTETEAEGEETDKAEAEDKPKDETKGEAEDKGEFEIPPEAQEAIDRRFAKMTRKHKEQVEALQTVISTLKAGASATPAELKVIEQYAKTPEKVNERIDAIDAFMEESEAAIEAAVDGIYTDTEGNEYKVEIIKARRDALKDERKALRKVGPRLSGWKQAEETGRKAYPALFDEDSPIYAEAREMLEKAPALRDLPDYWTIIGDAIQGRKARTSKATTTGNAGETPRRPPPTPKGAPGATAGATRQAGPGRDDAQPGSISEEFANQGYDEDALRKSLRNFNRRAS